MSVVEGEVDNELTTDRLATPESFASVLQDEEEEALKGEKAVSFKASDGNTDAINKWMGSWMKTFSEAVTRAPEQFGEIISRSKKKSQSGARSLLNIKRIDQIASILEAVKGSGDVRIIGPDCIGGLQVLKFIGSREDGQADHSSIPAILGTEEDESWLYVEWYRKRVGSNFWDQIPGRHSGYYRPGPDDLGCKLKASVRFNTNCIDPEIIDSCLSAISKKNSSLPAGQKMLVTDPRRLLWIEKKNCLGISAAIHEALEPLKATRSSYQISVSSNKAPFVKSLLVIDPQDDGVTVSLSLELQSAHHKDAGDELNAKLSEAGNDPNQFSMLLHGHGSRISIDAISDSDTGFTLNKHERNHDLITFYASTNSDRDVVVLYLRWLLHAEDKPLATAFDAIDCVYPQVWAMLDVLQELESPGYSSEITEDERTASSVDCCPQGADIQDRQESIAIQDGEDGFAFDIYKIAGFGDSYAVEVESCGNEPLGITLSGIEALQPIRSCERFWPKRGVCFVVVSGFRPVLINGRKVMGKIEATGKVKVGDALFAVDEWPLELVALRNRSDLDNYIPTSVSYASQLIEAARNHCQNLLTADENIGNNGIRPDCIGNDTNANNRLRLTFRRGSPILSDQFGQTFRASGAYRSVELDNEATKPADERMDSSENKERQTLDESNSIQCANCISVNEIFIKQRQKLERSSIEKKLALRMMQQMRDQLQTCNDKWQNERTTMRSSIEKATLGKEKTSQEKQAADEKVEQLKNALKTKADELSRFANLIQARDDLLQKSESEVYSHQVKNANLRNLLDTIVVERDEAKKEILELSKSLETSTEKITRLRDKLAISKEEVEYLTKNMKHNKDINNSQLIQVNNENQALREEIAKLSDSINGFQIHTEALKLTATKAEEGSLKASISQRKIEEQLREEKAKTKTLQERVDQLQKRLRGSTSEIIIEGKASNSEYRTENSEEKTTEDQLKDSENTNIKLRKQLAGLKKKMHSLAAEASKAAQLQDIVAERNELLLKVQIEKAQRLESEDELNAYKQALKQVAEEFQPQNSERLSIFNSGQSLRKGLHDQDGASIKSASPIFNHLYRKICSEKRSVFSSKK